MLGLGVPAPGGLVQSPTENALLDAVGVGDADAGLAVLVLRASDPDGGETAPHAVSSQTVTSRAERLIC
jgi:hypothetical protein